MKSFPPGGSPRGPRARADRHRLRAGFNSGSTAQIPPGGSFAFWNRACKQTTCRWMLHVWTCLYFSFCQVAMGDTVLSFYMSGGLTTNIFLQRIWSQKLNCHPELKELTDVWWMPWMNWKVSLTFTVTKAGVGIDHKMDHMGAWSKA